MNREKRDSLGEWRARLKPWLMATVRLAAGWLVSRADFIALLAPDSAFRLGRGVFCPDALAVLLGAGLLGFATPRTCLPGAVLFAGALATFEWWWRQDGGSPGPLPWSLGIIAVLALGEWLAKRLRARYPGT